MPSNYVTVFEVSRSQSEWILVIAGPLLICVGVSLLILWIISNRYRPPYRVGLILCVAGAVGSMIGITQWNEDSAAVSALRDGPYRIVEGVVSDFKPMPYEGHQEECFSVQQMRFCYSDYEITPGFHQSTSHGGPIHEGLPVRITYHDGTILRLQIPEDQVASPAHSRAIERASERDWQRRTDADPLVQRMPVAWYIVMLGWVTWWNWKWKLVMRFWLRAPHRRWTEIGFRLFFAANLIGAVVGLITYVHNHPVSPSSILPTLITTGIIGAVATVMSFVALKTAQRRDKQQSVPKV